MAENLFLTATDKEARYKELLPQLIALTSGETNLIANLANTAAALKQTFNFFWVGFYMVEGDELILGPFQGPVACTRISKGKGVCGVVWESGESIIVPNVDEFPGHIACSSESKSEIVLPGRIDGKIRLLLDIDSDELNSFDETDRKYLEKMLEEIL